MEKMMQKFEQVFVDDTKNGKKIPTSKYLVNGKYSIIDQGQNQIGGYTDMGEGIYDNVPAIVFGDHTRVVKYIDKPFYIGADGVKILKAIDSHNCVKYLYYYLSSKKIENTGYNRHFKWLKEKTFEIPSLPEQESTAGKIDVVCESMEKQKKQLELCDTLIKSKFNEMFGNPVINDKGWELNKFEQVLADDTKNGFKLPTKFYNESGKYQIIDQGQTEVCGYTNIEEGVYTKVPRIIFGDHTRVIKYVDKPFFIGADGVKILKPINNEFLPNYLYYFLKFNEIQNTGYNRHFKWLKEVFFIKPPLPLQQKFADFVNEVEQNKAKIKQSLNETETLYKALMQKYFEKGENV